MLGPVQGEISQILTVGDRRVAYVKVPAPPGSGRKTSLVTIYEPPEAFRVRSPVWVRPRENGGWELA